MTDTAATLYCSFCGKTQHEVRKLIAGPTSFICNECVELCNEIVDATTPASERAKLRKWAVEHAIVLQGNGGTYRDRTAIEIATELTSFVTSPHKPAVNMSDVVSVRGSTAAEAASDSDEKSNR